MDYEPSLDGPGAGTPQAGGSGSYPGAEVAGNQPAGWYPAEQTPSPSQPAAYDDPAAWLTGADSSAAMLGSSDSTRSERAAPGPGARARVQSRRRQTKDRPLGTPALVVRGLGFGWCAVGAALGGLAAAQAGHWLTYVAIGVYGVLALYGLATVRGPVGKQRLIAELVVVALATVGLKLAPRFLMDAQPATAAGGPAGGKDDPASAKGTPMGRFAGMAEAYAQALDELASLDRAAGYSWWQRLEQHLDLEPMRTLHVSLDDNAKARVFDLWSAVRERDPEVQSLVAKRDAKDPGYEPALTAEDRAALRALRDEVKRHTVRLTEALQFHDGE